LGLRGLGPPRLKVASPLLPAKMFKQRKKNKKKISLSLSAGSCYVLGIFFQSAPIPFDDILSKSLKL
jgi:hypothetical protein